MTIRQIGKAMVEQLDRVNHDPKRLLEMIDELNQTLAKKDRAIKLLMQQIDFMNDGGQLQQSGYYECKDKRYLDGERVYTLSEAADLCSPRISYDIAYRYIRDEYWSAVWHPDSRQWLVHASNTFVRRPRKKAQRRKLKS